MSLKVFIRLVQTSDTVDSDWDLKLDGDINKVIELQTNVTVLNVKVNVRVRMFGGQLELR